MEIHNLMEDLVKSTVNELFDAEEKGKSSWCTCYQCRMDVACYVLNRMKVEYVVSSRGLVHAEQDYNEKLQRIADVVSLVREGWSKINATKRPHFEHSNKQIGVQVPAGPVYNIPPIMGRLFHGLDFSPMQDVDVSLIDADGSLVAMMDPNWQNPCTLVKNTAGTFIFWPFPLVAKAGAGEKLFSFGIVIKKAGFDDLTRFIEFRLACAGSAQDQFSLEEVHHLPDLYLFPESKDEQDT